MSGPEVRWAVRVATTRDISGVVALERMLPELPHWKTAEYARYVGTENGGGERLLLIAEAASGGEMLGFAAAVCRSPPVSVAELESVGVAMVARRQGVARSLCERVLQWASGRGAKAAELEVRSRSAGAMALYESVGFAATGRRVGYYTDPVDDAVLMSRQLVDARWAR